MVKPVGYEAVCRRLGAQFDQVDGEQFYADIFNNNECVGEINTDYSKPNAIYLYKGDDRMRRRIMLSDTWGDDYANYVAGNTRALCSGLAYRGRANTLDNAQRMHALIIDLDAVGDPELQNLLFTRFGKPPSQLRSMPMPTYIVASGTGLHIYYLLDQPIDLFPAIRLQLKELKNDLTFRLWDYKSTTRLRNVQYQSINQCFRMVDSINEKYGNIIRAFRTGEPININTLNQYVKPDNAVDITARKIRGATPLAEAKEKWPEWYDKVIINGVKEKKKWDIAGKVHGKDPYALYHWWLKQLDQVIGGHRYFYLMCTVAYARKCNVPKKILIDDLRKSYEQLKLVDHINPLTIHDYNSALKTWPKDFYNLTIDQITKLTGVIIQKNKRNGRNQAAHLARARAVRDVDYPDGSWRNGNGRKTKKDIVQNWRRENPTGKKIDCERATGLSRHTIIKWWDPAE